MLARTEDPIVRRKLAETLLQYGGFIDILESEIVRYASDLRVLGDQEILEAITTLKKTYQTEAKGIIFEHKSSNPLVQALVQDLVARLKKETEEASRPLPATENIVDCLEVMDANLRFHAQDEERESYLQFIRRRHPTKGGGGSEGGLLIRP